MSEKLNKNYNFRTERIGFFYFFCILKLLQFNQQIEIFNAQFWFFFFDPSWTETFNLFCILKLFQFNQQIEILNAHFNAHFLFIYFFD